jgi:hypothetical protein
MRLIAIDFVLAFALIWASVFAVEFARSRAHAEGLLNTAVVHAAAELGEDGELPPTTASYLLFSLAAAAVAAFDLAFWRHLRRAYASPRRGRRRG